MFTHYVDLSSNIILMLVISLVLSRVKEEILPFWSISAVHLVTRHVFLKSQIKKPS